MVNEKHRSQAFQGKHEGEEFQFYFRQHWIRLLGPFLRTLFVTLAVLIVGYFTLYQGDWDDSFGRRLTMLALVVVFLVFNIAFLIRFYRYFLYVIVITDKKLHRIKKTLLTTDDHQSVDLWSLQDIHKSQHGLVQNIFGYGSILLEAQETEIRVHFVPHITDKYVRLMALQERARSSMGGSIQYAKRRRGEQPSVQL